MRKIMFIGLLAIISVFSVKAQTVDTVYFNKFRKIAVRITPIKVIYSDTVNSTHLLVSGQQDNLKFACDLHYQLLDDKGHTHLEGDVIMSGTDYTTWQNIGNVYPYTFIANKLRLTISN